MSSNSRRIFESGLVMIGTLDLFVLGSTVVMLFILAWFSFRKSPDTGED